MVEHYFPSCGSGQIHVSRWEPEGQPRAVVQIVHGIAEHTQRYDEFANYLNALGYLVVAEDHMGHGKSIGTEGVPGYFAGGWFSAVDDTYHLLRMTKEAYPYLPYILLGHSMGSFMSRTILEKYPNSGITACVLSGTGWLPNALLHVGIPIAKAACKFHGASKPSPRLQNLVFGGYNKNVPHKRTEFDWLCSRDAVVDAYMADPLCGFVASASLLRDLQLGIQYIQSEENLLRMNKALPVLFVAGEEDPVGNYGAGVKQTAENFRNCGMENVTCKLYPRMRHEILNETDRQNVYQDIAQWIADTTL